METLWAFGSKIINFHELKGFKRKNAGFAVKKKKKAGPNMTNDRKLREAFFNLP